MKTWRDIAAPKIRKIISEAGTDDIGLLRKALKEGYPFFERKYWPYKIWCDEVRIQLGLKNRRSRLGQDSSRVPIAGQKSLFD